MAQTLRLKRSSVPGRVPTTATLQTGEIAINTADGLVYIRKDDDSIIPLLGANTTVTGSVVLLGSIEATSFTGSFSGSFVGPITGTLSKTVGSGDGIVSFLFDGSDNVTVTLDTGSDHFRNAVIDLIDTNAPSIIAQDTTGPSGIDLSYNSNTGALSGSLLYSDIQLGSTTIQLGNSATAVSDLTVTGSFKGNIEGTASWADNATSASHALIADQAISASFTTTASYSAFTSEAVSSSYANFASQALSSSYATTASYANFASNAETSSYAEFTPTALSASYATTASYANFASNAESSSYASFASTATSASFTSTAVSASYASFASTSTSASYAQNASSADTSISASHALIADYALNANVETGSLVQTGSIVDATITLTKANGTSFDLTVDNVASASYASYAAVATSVVGLPSGSYLTTGSISNATITLTKADESTFDLTVNNVANATSASYAVSSSYAVSASYATFTAFAQDAISASYAATASSADDFLVRGDLNVDGIVTAREFHTTFISASIVYSSGSTKFGDTADDLHEFTGSVVVSGSIDSDDITIDQWGSVSASLALLSGSITSLTLQQVTDSGNSTTLVISASNLNITGFPDVSASLAELYDTSASLASELTLVSATASAAYNYTLQDITDNGNSTNLVISASNLNITGFPDVSASLAELYDTSASLASELTLVSATASAAYNYTLQDITDNGNSTTLVVSASNLNITGFPDVSASLAALESTNTLQGVTDNGNTTTNEVIINNQLQVSQSIYSKGEEVLDFAVAMAIALG